MRREGGDDLFPPKKAAVEEGHVEVLWKLESVHDADGSSWQSPVCIRSWKLMESHGVVILPRHWGTDVQPCCSHAKEL